MPNNQGFADAIRAVVAQEVNAALAPYREALANLAEFTGAPVSAPGPSPRSASFGEAPRRRRGRAVKSSPEVAMKFTEGQKVQYRQGRGTFDAKVIEIDTEKGVLKLERDGDSKKVYRPASKVIAA